MLTTKDYLISYFKKNWFKYLIGLSLVFISTYYTASIPRLLGEAIDCLRSSSPSDEILDAAKKIAFAAFIAFAMRFVWRYLVLGFCRGAETYIRVQLFKHLESLSSDFYIKYNTGDIITRSITDVTAIRRMFGFGFVAVLDTITIFATSAYNMFSTAGVAMSLTAMLPAPFLVFFISRIRKKLRSRQYEIREAASNLASKVQENLTGIRVIKTYAQENSETDNFKDLSEIRWDKEMRMVRLSASISPIIQMAFAVVFAIFIIFGSRMVANGTMTLGQFTAFNGYISLMINPVAMIGRVIELWQTGMSSIMRLDEMFKYRSSVNDDFADEDLKIIRGQIEFKNLSFSYPTLSAESKKSSGVLNGLNFTIKPGETIAVTGPVGSGKSTLASIILRQWKIGQGVIAFDGNDINSIPVKNLRDAIGYVPQDSFLFSDSIMNNIRFYDSSISDEDVYTAAKAVSIHDNIMAFQDKYDTVVGERGMTLSGGQKQRVSIARALVRKPKILLLDDCLSAVDAETEHAIISGLKQYMNDVTGIIITHRVAAAALADRILVLNDNGGMSEMGTYEELMLKKGDFYNLVMIQTGESGKTETVSKPKKKSEKKSDADMARELAQHLSNRLAEVE